MVADQSWKCASPLQLHLLDVVGFEIAVAGLVEANENGHDFAQRQTSSSIAVNESIAEQLLVPEGFKLLAEIIDGAEQVF